MSKIHSELLKVYSVCLIFFLLHLKIILFFYRMIQKNSGLLKNFQIAMLPCYRGFSLSALSLPFPHAPVPVAGREWDCRGRCAPVGAPAAGWQVGSGILEGRWAPAAALAAGLQVWKLMWLLSLFLRRVVVTWKEHRSSYFLLIAVLQPIQWRLRVDVIYDNQYVRVTCEDILHSFNSGRCGGCYWTMEDSSACYLWGYLALVQ